MKDDISKLLDTLASSCADFIETPLLRAKVMINLANDILSDFPTVEQSLKAFDLLCNFGRKFFEEAKLKEDCSEVVSHI